MIQGIDVSRWQGDINWPAVKASGIQFAIIKISGGDDGLYYDSKATANYNGAKGAGIAGIGGYHFAGGTDPIAEADYYLRGMKPFAENDVFVLDWELPNASWAGGKAVQWCLSFVTRVHDATGVWPLLYINGSTWNAFDWRPVTNVCGVYVAWYGKSPADTLAVPGVYVMHQYTSNGAVAGISGAVDLDAFFGTIDQFNKYGWHAPTPPPAPVVTTTVVTETKDIPFDHLTVETDQLDAGVHQISQYGQDGVETLTYTVTLTDGAETGRMLASDVITVHPTNEITLVGTRVPAPTPEPTPTPTPEPTPIPTPTPKPANDTLFAELSKLVAVVVAWLKSWHK